MTDQTLFALVLIGLVFGGAAAARILLRAALVVGAVLRDLATPAARTVAVPFHRLGLSRAA